MQQNLQGLQPIGVSQFEVQGLPASGLKAGKDAGDNICNLMRLVGEAFRLQSIFQCAEAEAHYKKLTTKQRETGWVQGQIAKCLFE